MEIDLTKCSLDELRAIYKKADEALSAALLDGASWEEVKEKRKVVTELSIQIYKRAQADNSSPADTPFRD